MGKVVLITGVSNSIGQCIAKLFLGLGYTVHGFDCKDSPENEIPEGGAFTLHKYQLCDMPPNMQLMILPTIEGVNHIIHNISIWGAEDSLTTTLNSTIAVSQKYGLQPEIESIVTLVDQFTASSKYGQLHAATQGGLLSHNKWLAHAVAEYGAVSNAVIFDRARCRIDRYDTKQAKLWSENVKGTPLEKYPTLDDIAEWVYFISTSAPPVTGEEFHITGKLK